MEKIYGIHGKFNFCLLYSRLHYVSVGLKIQIAQQLLAGTLLYQISTKPKKPFVGYMEKPIFGFM
jgi:hypothetical protein